MDPVARARPPQRQSCQLAAQPQPPRPERQLAGVYKTHSHTVPRLRTCRIASRGVSVGSPSVMLITSTGLASCPRAAWASTMGCSTLDCMLAASGVGPENCTWGDRTEGGEAGWPMRRLAAGSPRARPLVTCARKMRGTGRTAAADLGAGPSPPPTARRAAPRRALPPAAARPPAHLAQQRGGVCGAAHAVALCRRVHEAHQDAVVVKQRGHLGAGVGLGGVRGGVLGGVCVSVGKAGVADGPAVRGREPRAKAKLLIRPS
jgi:hypothetical protein